MWTLVRSIIAFAIGGLVARALTGAGLALVGYWIVGDLVLEALEFAKTSMGGLPADVLQLLLLMGVGEYLSIVGSAVLARAAIVAAASAVGIKTE